MKPNTCLLQRLGCWVSIFIYVNGSLKSGILRINKMLLEFHCSTQPTYTLGFYFQTHVIVKKMNTQVTSAQSESYRENGFLVIDDFLTGAELSAWQDAVDEAVAQFMKRDDAYHNQRGEDGYYKNVFVQCVNLWKTNEKIKQLILEHELGRVAADLAGTSSVRLPCSLCRRMPHSILPPFQC